ncbi:hypothetical protein MXAZACID_11315 [Acidocella sp. MX-AZ02]|nr:hypothetical protein MXAZACID_11315 [Acidocella sp. MX-AZ02]
MRTSRKKNIFFPPPRGGNGHQSVKSARVFARRQRSRSCRLSSARSARWRGGDLVFGYCATRAIRCA